MEKHISIAAALNIGLGILWLLLAVFIFAVLLGIGLVSADPQVLRIVSFLGSIAVFFLLVIAVARIIGGIGLWKRRAWSRILLLVVSVVGLLDIPVGTALGIYTIWVLVHENTKKLLESPSA